MIRPFSAKADQPSAGALSPSAVHWSAHAIGRSMRRLIPDPQGSRPWIGALVRVWEKKDERQGSADPARRLALARGERFDGSVGIGRLLVEPKMGVAKGVNKNCARFGSHPLY